MMRLDALNIGIIESIAGMLTKEINGNSLKLKRCGLSWDYLWLHTTALLEQVCSCTRIRIRRR